MILIDKAVKSEYDELKRNAIYYFGTLYFINNSNIYLYKT